MVLKNVAVFFLTILRSFSVSDFHTVAAVDGYELAASIAMTASENRFSRRHNTTKCRQTLRIALPLSFRKFAIVLKSSVRRPVSHINSTFRWASRFRGRSASTESG